MRREITGTAPFRVTTALAIRAGERAPIYIGSGLVAVATTIAGRAPEAAALEGHRSRFWGFYTIAPVLVIARQVAMDQKLVVVVAIPIPDPGLGAAVSSFAVIDITRFTI